MTSSDKPVTELLEGLPAVELDDVALRRLRQRVLEGAAEGETAPPSARARRQPRRLLVSSVTCAILGAALVALWSPRRSAEEADFAANVRSSDGSAIRWSRRIEAGTEWIDLQEGRFLLEVHARSAAGRVVVRVPDGRIDDLGTVFEVWIEDGRTTHVHVAEGRVALWLQGTPGAILSSGQGWEMAPVPRALPSTSTTTPAPTLASPTLAPSAAASGLRPLPRRPADEIARRHEEAEDASYLKVIRLMRASRTAEAQQAALEYVRHFPGGFRVEEMNRVTAP